MTRPWSFDEAGTSYVDEWGPDRLHLDADIAADEIANLMYRHGVAEDVDGDEDAWSIVTGHLDWVLQAIAECRQTMPALDAVLVNQYGWPSLRPGHRNVTDEGVPVAAPDDSVDQAGAVIGDTAPADLSHVEACRTCNDSRGCDAAWCILGVAVRPS